MKRVLFLISLGGLFCVSAWGRDLNSDRRGLHYVSFSAGGGWYSLMETLPDLNTTGGGSAFAGVGYELRYKNFWLGTGVDLQYFGNTATTNGSLFSQMMYDTQGKQMTCHYDVYDDKEQVQGANVGIPLIVGAQFLNGFYLGAGARFQVNMAATASSRVTYRTSATYDRYIADFESMPNHWYQPYTVTGRQRVTMRPEVSLVAEVGYDVFAHAYEALTTLHPPVLKVAAYAEIGVMNVLKNEGDLPRYTINAENPMYLDIVPYYRAIDTNVNKFLPLFVGVKLTYLFLVPKRDCRCL